MEKIKSDKFQGISVIILYFVMLLIVPLGFNFKLSGYSYLIFNLMYQVVIIASIMLILNKKITKSFKDFKKNHLKYFKENFKYYLLGLLIMFVSNAIIIFILNNGIAGNEEAVRGMIVENPIFSYILAVFFAPVLEELVFRQGFRLAIKNDVAFVLASGLIFGFIHILTDFSGLSSFLYLIPYSSLGLAFAYILAKTDNIFTTIGLHMMHNGILLSLQILVMMFS